MWQTAAEYLGHQARLRGQHEQVIVRAEMFGDARPRHLLPACADMLAGASPIANMPDQAASQGAGARQARRWAVQAASSLASTAAGLFFGHAASVIVQVSVAQYKVQRTGAELLGP